MRVLRKLLGWSTARLRSRFTRCPQGSAAYVRMREQKWRSGIHPSKVLPSFLWLFVFTVSAGFARNASQGPAQGPNDKVAKLIMKADNAIKAEEWRKAEVLLNQIIETEPNRWESYEVAGNVKSHLEEYRDAIESYKKGIELAQDRINYATDSTGMRTGIMQMLRSEANAYLHLREPEKAIPLFTKSAEMDSNPTKAYSSLCTTLYKSGNMGPAAAACDKAIATDPSNADTYFIKGIALYSSGKVDRHGKYVVPPGTTKALRKYLSLAPDGPHANDVKAMLAMSADD